VAIAPPVSSLTQVSPGFGGLAIVRIRLSPVVAEGAMEPGIDFFASTRVRLTLKKETP